MYYLISLTGAENIDINFPALPQVAFKKREEKYGFTKS